MTTIYQVRDNLKRTIEGKEQYLVEVRAARDRALEVEGAGARAEETALFFTAQMLNENLNELRRILFDVEKCCETATANSWIGVDRQGGI